MDLTNTGLPGAPFDWIQPGPPDNWVGYQPKHNALKKEDINNPGHWSDYLFQPKYLKHIYQGHFIPCNVQVTPKSSNGNRTLGS